MPKCCTRKKWPPLHWLIISSSIFGLLISSNCLADKKEIATELNRVSKAGQSIYNANIKFSDDGYQSIAEQVKKDIGIELPDSIKEKYLACFRDPALLKVIDDIVVDLYAETYTEEELLFVLDFMNHKGVSPESFMITKSFKEKNELLDKAAKERMQPVFTQCVDNGYAIIKTYINSQTPSDVASVGATITDYGIYEYQSERILKKDKNTTAGYTSRLEKRNADYTIKQTTDIPLIKGTVFGYRAKLTGLPDDVGVSVQVRYEHPPIVGSNGKMSTGFTLTKYAKGSNGVFDAGVHYRLSEDYELAPGKWTFSIIYDDRVLASKTFVLQ